MISGPAEGRTEGAAAYEAAPEAEDAAPAGVDLVLYASVSSDLAEGDATVPAVLARHGLDARRWAHASSVWTRRVTVDALGEERPLATRYSDAFTARQDAYRPVPPMSPEAWAELVVEMGRDGATPLAARGLSSSDYLRLSRHWARALGGSPELSERYSQRFYELTSRAGARLPARRSGRPAPRRQRRIPRRACSVW